MNIENEIKKLIPNVCEDFITFPLWEEGDYRPTVNIWKHFKELPKEIKNCSEFDLDIVGCKNKDLFYEELTDYIEQYYNIPNLGDIITTQYHKMKDPYIVYDGDLERWCKDCMWWGRRVERFFVGEYLDA